MSTTGVTTIPTSPPSKEPLPSPPTHPTNILFISNLQNIMLEHRRSIANFLCGGMSAVTNIVVVFPFYKTIFFQQLHGCSWPNAVVQIYHEGLSNLYRGVMPPLLQKSVSVSLMFGVYAHTDEFLKEHISSPTASRGISAICAGAVEATLCPFERVQTLLQNEKSAVRYRNTFDAFRGLCVEQHGGVRELYRGFTPCLVRNVIGNLSYFLAREEIVKWWPPPDASRSQHLFADFLTGAVLGAWISALIFPLNTVKTRIQAQIGGPHPNMFVSLRDVYVERGRSVKKLFRGLPANCVRSMISWGVITMTVNFYKSVLFPDVV